MLGAAAPASAQVITGTLNEYNHPPYAGIASHFSLANFHAGGVSMFGGEVVIFCSDFAARSLDEDSLTYPFVLTNGNSTLSLGTTDQMDVWSRYATPQDEALAMSMALWLVDNYYEDYFVSPPSEANERQYAFQNVLWEIFGDGGTANGLNFSTGNIARDKFGPGGIAPAPVLWAHMTNLLNAVANSGVTAAYQPIYDVRAALDSRSGYQDYLILADDPADMLLVPEPTVSLLGLASVMLVCGRRTRR